MDPSAAPQSDAPAAATHADAVWRRRQVLRFGLAIAVLLLARLLIGDKPWDAEVRAWLAEGRPKGYVATWGWWASLANLALVTLAVATRRLWLRGAGEPTEVTRYAPPEGADAGRPWFRWLLLAAVLAHVLVAGPRLFHSWWGDEEHTVRHAIVGQWYVVDGELDHDDIKWRDALYYYTQGNNPVPLSVAGLVSWKLWTALGGDPWRCEPAVRAVPFVLGALSVLLTGLFLRRIGLPVAGVLAAWLLVLHPWHLRYATQIRAYPMMLALVPSMLLAMVNVMHRGTWRRWALHGLLQVLMLWVYPGALWFVVTLNVALAIAVHALHRGTDALVVQAVRFVVTGLGSAALWLQLMAPNVGQLLAYLREKASVPTPRGTLRDVLSFMLSGMPFPDRGAGPWYPELADLLAAHPLAVQAFAVATLALLALGAARLVARGHGAAVAVMLLPGPLTFLFAEIQTTYLYPWYVLFALPTAVMLVAVGVATLFVGLRERRDFLAATAVAALVYLSAFAWISWEPRTVLRSRSYEPFRESVDAIRPSLDPRDPANARILTASVHGETAYYDPLAYDVDTVQELRRLMRRSRKEQKPLFVTFGRLDLVTTREPDVLAHLRDPAEFQLVAIFPGFLPQYTRYVYLYRGGPPAPVRARGILDEPGAREAAAGA